MKDIFNKPAKILDLSQQDKISYSPYTLDLSPEHKVKSEPDSRQTSFFEYMPTAIERERSASVWQRATATVLAAVAPLRMYWVIVVGIGLIVGLAMIAYMASHRDWTAALPNVPFGSTTTNQQGNQNFPTQAPSKGGGSALQSATPDAAQKTMPAVGASASQAPAPTPLSLLQPVKDTLPPVADKIL